MEVIGILVSLPPSKRIWERSVEAINAVMGWQGPDTVSFIDGLLRGNLIVLRTLGQSTREEQCNPGGRNAKYKTMSEAKLEVVEILTSLARSYGVWDQALDATNTRMNWHSGATNSRPIRQTRATSELP